MTQEKNSVNYLGPFLTMVFLFLIIGFAVCRCCWFSCEYCIGRCCVAFAACACCCL